MCYYEKTLLVSYTTLESVVEELEGLVMAKALASFSSRDSCERQAEKILSLIEKKSKLIELKQKLDEVFVLMSSESLELISYKYFKTESERPDFDHTSRKYFRKQIKALKEFSQKLLKAGMTEEWFKNKFLDISFLNSIYSRMKKNESKEHAA